MKGWRAGREFEPMSLRFQKRSTGCFLLTITSNRLTVPRTATNEAVMGNSGTVGLGLGDDVGGEFVGLKVSVEDDTISPVDRFIVCMLQGLAVPTMIG